MRVDLLNVMAFIDRSGIIAYIFTIILTIIFNMLGFRIINNIISNIFKGLYFIILIGAIFSFYKSKKKNNKSLIFIFLPIFLLFTGIPFKVVTMVIVCPLFFLKGIKQILKVIGILIYLTFIVIGLFGLSFGEFGTNTIVDQQYSPNEMYRIVTVDSDQGALGGDTYVELQKIYFGIIKKNIETLYHGHWGEKPKLIWVDNNMVRIDGRDMNIHTSKTWENKN